MSFESVTEYSRLDHEGAVCCVTNPHDVGMAATAADDGSVRFWNRRKK